MVPILWKILRAVALILAVIWLTLQVRKPRGWLGKRIVRAMNLGHARMTNWALQQIATTEDAAILDIGCGGGGTVRRLAAMAPAGKIVGLDYSVASVAISRETNAEEINAGWRVDRRPGNRRRTEVLLLAHLNLPVARHRDNRPETEPIQS